MSAEAAYVTEYNAKYHEPPRTTPTVPPWGERLECEALLGEEMAEYQEASAESDIVEVADALADIVYTAYSVACRWGIPLDAVIREVHRSNMTKTVNPEGGKALKLDDFQEPRIAAVLALYEDVD